MSAFDVARPSRHWQAPKQLKRGELEGDEVLHSWRRFEEMQEYVPPVEDCFSFADGFGIASDGDETGERIADALYDPKLDELDQAFVSERTHARDDGSEHCTLCCPQCFTLVCIDAKQDPHFSNQFDSNNSMNTEIDTGHRVLPHVVSTKSKAKKKKMKGSKTATQSTVSVPMTDSIVQADVAQDTWRCHGFEADSEFHNVCCIGCALVVGVCDSKPLAKSALKARAKFHFKHRVSAEQLSEMIDSTALLCASQDLGIGLSTAALTETESAFESCVDKTETVGDSDIASGIWTEVGGVTDKSRDVTEAEDGDVGLEELREWLSSQQRVFHWFEALPGVL